MNAVRDVRPVLIAGAGPAGLATAAELTQYGVPYRLFERGWSLAYCWENAYDSLTLHTGKHMSALPRRPHARTTPLFLSKNDFVQYLRDYARHFSLRVETGLEVRHARRDADGWRVSVDGHDVRGRALVMATGIMSKPMMPAIPGMAQFRGEVVHSITYRRPHPYAGKRVLVIGVGNSGAEIASELARVGSDVTIVIRRGANVVPRAILGVPLQYIAAGLRTLPVSARRRIAALVQQFSELKRGPQPFPRPPWSALEAIPVIGFHLVDAVREGRVHVQLGDVQALTPTGARFADGGAKDFDVVICATGFRPALDALGSAVRVDDRGFALRSDRVTSADLPDLYFVGHNYDALGGIANIRQDAVIVGAKLGSRESVVGNRLSGIGNRESGIGNRESGNRG
jgi:indole-3-pyruvate monooxygenase